MRINWINVIVYAVFALAAIIATVLPGLGISPWPFIALLAVWTYGNRED